MTKPQAKRKPRVTEEEHKAISVHNSLRQLRNMGWLVAVHNDYMLNNERHTFWLFTASHGPYFAKGESTEDYYAINQVWQKVEDIERWSRKQVADAKP